MARRAVSETDNEGPIPSPEAYLLTFMWYYRVMTTILLILIVWYATKVYYTKTFNIQTPVKEEGPMVHIQCYKCAQTIYTHRDNLRAPFYCVACG